MKWKMEREHMEAELRFYRAVEEEQKKWELREERMFLLTTTPKKNNQKWRDHTHLNGTVKKTALRAEARDFCPTGKETDKSSNPTLMKEYIWKAREVEEQSVRKDPSMIVNRLRHQPNFYQSQNSLGRIRRMKASMVFLSG